MQAALRQGQKARAALVSLALAGLVGYNLAVYLPSRLDEMYGLYDIQRARMAPFQTAEAQALAPALVIVHPQKRWTDYGTLLELSDPFLDTPFIFVISRGPEQDTAVAELFPERKTVHYYADEPFKLYTGLRGE